MFSFPSFCWARSRSRERRRKRSCRTTCHLFLRAKKSGQFSESSLPVFCIPIRSPHSKIDFKASGCPAKAPLPRFPSVFQFDLRKSSERPLNPKQRILYFQTAPTTTSCAPEFPLRTAGDASYAQNHPRDDKPRARVLYFIFSFWE